MSAYILLHWQNSEPGKEFSYAQWLRESLSEKLLRQPGFESVQLLALQPVQMQPSYVQPWRFCNIYELDTDDLAATLAIFSAAARQEARQAGWLRDDAANAFELTRPQLDTSRAYDPNAPLHLSIVMGNCIEGKDREYDEWYDNIHSPEVLDTPDFVGMRRGRLASSQAFPENEQPANRLVLLQIRSHDLHGSVTEFIGRAFGRSPSGVKWRPRELAAGFASLNRTVHVFTPFSPRLTRS